MCIIQHGKFATRAQTLMVQTFVIHLLQVPTIGIHTGVYKNKYYMITILQISIRFHMPY